MAEPENKPAETNTEESPRPASGGATAAASPEEGKKAGIFSAIKSWKLDKFSLLGAALFGAMLMNAVLLGLVSVKPARIVQTTFTAAPESHSNFSKLPTDIPSPEKHIDILSGMADTYRRLGELDKAKEIYALASRAFEASDHGKLLRNAPVEAADKLFEEGKYREARSRYYSFLATADDLPAEDIALIQKAHFRIAECFLRETLSGKEKP